MCGAEAFGSCLGNAKHQSPNQSMHQLFNVNIHPCCYLPYGRTTRHGQAFKIGRLGQATCSVWSSARLIKVQGNPGQAGFLFHRVATKQACMKSSHNPRPGKRCSGCKPNWPYISLVHTYTCLARAIHIDPSNTLRPCSLSM